MNRKEPRVPVRDQGVHKGSLDNLEAAFNHTRTNRHNTKKYISIQSIFQTLHEPNNFSVVPLVDLVSRRARCCPNFSVVPLVDLVSRRPRRQEQTRCSVVPLVDLVSRRARHRLNFSVVPLVDLVSRRPRRQEQTRCSVRRAARGSCFPKAMALS